MWGSRNTNTRTERQIRRDSRGFESASRGSVAFLGPCDWHYNARGIFLYESMPHIFSVLSVSLETANNLSCTFSSHSVFYLKTAVIWGRMACWIQSAGAGTVTFCLCVCACAYMFMHLGAGLQSNRGAVYTQQIELLCKRCWLSLFRANICVSPQWKAMKSNSPEINNPFILSLGHLQIPGST